MSKVKVVIEGHYDEMITLFVELCNAADRSMRDNLELHNGENERLARRAKTLQAAAQKFEEATFMFPTPGGWEPAVPLSNIHVAQSAPK